MKNYKKKLAHIKTEIFLNNFPLVFLLQYNNFTVKDWFLLKREIGDITKNTPPSTKKIFGGQLDNSPSLHQEREGLLTKGGPNDEFRAVHLPQYPRFEKNIEILNVKNSLLKTSVFLHHNQVKNGELLQGEDSSLPRNPIHHFGGGSSIFHKKLKGGQVVHQKDFWWKDQNQKQKKNDSFPNVEYALQGPMMAIGCKNSLHVPQIYQVIRGFSKLVLICCIHKEQFLNHLDLQALLKTTPLIYHDFLQILGQHSNLYQLLHHQLQLDPLVSIQRDFLKTVSSVMGPHE
jgi:hypothetical protein